MRLQPDIFVEKHLARNVPLDFNACCQRVRMAQFGAPSSKRRSQHLGWLDYMLRELSHEGFNDKEVEEVNHEIDEVQVRYLAIQKTLDLSIPVRPIFDELWRLRRYLEKSEEKLSDEDRDREVLFFMGLTDEGRIPSSMEAFHSAGSISERAAIARQMVAQWVTALDEMLEYFDYKKGLVTRGNISLFATKFAVHALADIFERKNTYGVKANIAEAFDDGRLGRRNPGRNSRRYTGRFLNFVTAFFQYVDPQQFQSDLDLGFQDRIRKITVARKKSPDVFRLLYGDVTVEDLLDFMRQAEAL